MVAQNSKPKRQYTAADLEQLYLNIKQACQKKCNNNDPTMLLAFYWLMRGRDVADIQSLVGRADLDDLLLPPIRAILPINPDKLSSISQISGDLNLRTQLFKMIGFYQNGSSYYNPKTMHVDSMVGWEVASHTEDAKIKIQIPAPVATTAKPKRRQPSTNTVQDQVKPKPKPYPPFIEHELTLPPAPPIPRAQIIPARTPPKQYLVIKQYVGRRPIFSKRHMNLKDFLENKKCRTLSSAVMEIVALSEPNDAKLISSFVLDAYELNQNGNLVRKPKYVDPKILAIFAKIFSEHFTIATNIQIAMRRIANVVHEINNPENLGDRIRSDLGWQRTSLPCENALGGESLLAKRVTVAQRGSM